MKLLKKLNKKLIRQFKKYILRDKFLLEVGKWFKINGDSTLRLNYPLGSSSLVFDLGGYHGDFAYEILKKFDCTIYIFEPVPEFYNICVERFKHNKKVKCFNFGLSDCDQNLTISLDENASSFFTKSNSEQMEVNIRSINDFILKENIQNIDLIKINIEGGEFEVIPALIESSNILKVNFLQVQFHNFIKDAVTKRKHIRQSLKLTHEEQWNYEFVWESWSRK